MASWRTTHYPHPCPDNLPWDIYLQKQHKYAVNGIEAGDRVFFYEYRWQKELVHRVEYSPGRQGIVCMARVQTGEVYPRDAVTPYADGDTKDWAWGVKCGDHDRGGFVTKSELLTVIRYSPGSNLRGFNGGTGIKKLTDAQAQHLIMLFKAGK